MKKFAVVGIVVVAVFLLPALSFAQPSGGGTPNSSGGGTPPAATGKTFPLINPLGKDCETLTCPIARILGNLWKLAIPVVMIMVIYAAFLFITGGSNPERITTARNVLLYTAIGYGLLLLAGSLSALVRNILAGN